MKRDKRADLLRQLVREEIMRGVPDVAISQVTDSYLSTLRSLVYRHVQQRSQGLADTSQMMLEVDESFDELSKELNELVSDALFRIVGKL